MPENVGERFLDNTKDCGLNLRVQARKLLWLNIKKRLNPAAFVYSIEIHSQRLGQARLVQQRGMQEIRDGANLLSLRRSGRISVWRRQDPALVRREARVQPGGVRRLAASTGGWTFAATEH